MTISEDSSLLADEPYQRQMTSYRRTRSAILAGAKSLVASHGLRRANMVDIANTAEVSRATLYNHFRDKSSVMRALLESEVERILLLAQSHSLPHEGLARISIEISTDPALSRIRITDPAMLSTILTNVDDPLWGHIRAGLSMVMGEGSITELSRLWLVGQVTQPLTADESHMQAWAIASLFKSA